MLARVEDAAVVPPAVYITEADYERLSPMAGSQADAPPGAALLRRELNRAVVVRDGEAPTRFVKLGSSVRYEDRSTRKVRTVQLVLPHAADLAENRLSVFTPVGAALIGLTVGQEFVWSFGAGRARILRILEVRDDHDGA